MECYIAFDIGGTMIKYGLIAPDLSILENHQIETQASMGGISIIRKIIDISNSYLEQGEYKYLGIAISTAGQLNPFTGQVIYASDAIPDYRHLNIIDMIREEIKLEVSVENDVNCALLAELDQNHVGITTMFTIGTGIGGAVAFDGNIIHGKCFSAGEIGYLPMHGSTFQNLASTRALIKKVENDLHISNLSGIQVFELAKENPIVQNAIDDFYDYLAQGLSASILLLSCDQLILGGAILNREDFIDNLLKKLSKYIPQHILNNVRITKAQHRNYAGMIGAVKWFEKRNSGDHNLDRNAMI